MFKAADKSAARQTFRFNLRYIFPNKALTGGSKHGTHLLGEDWDSHPVRRLLFAMVSHLWFHLAIIGWLRPSGKQGCSAF